MKASPVNASKKPIPLHAIWWLDAAGGGDTANPTHPIPMVTVGFLVENTEGHVTIAAELHSNGDLRDMTTIPRGIVKSLKRVGSVRVPAWVIKHCEKHPPK